MALIVAQLSMSLDGFVADSSDGVEHVFGWYGAGPVTVTMPGDSRTLRVSEPSAVHLRDLYARIGAVVSGRRTFDLTSGWRGGPHPVGAPVFVVTHQVPEGWPREDVPFTFVTDGVETAVAQAAATAGDRIVFVGSPDLAWQCLTAGLLDELRIDLVPVLLGDGIRLFHEVASSPLRLDLTRVVEGAGVTHLCYRPAQVIGNAASHTSSIGAAASTSVK